LYPGPGVYAGPGFYPRFYGNYREYRVLSTDNLRTTTDKYHLQTNRNSDNTPQGIESVQGTTKLLTANHNKIYKFRARQ